MRTTLSEASLYEFYEKFVLLQFGLVNQSMEWKYSDAFGPDEDAHYFSSNGTDYVLIFEDYGGLAVEKDYIKDNIDLCGKEFTYVEPIAVTAYPPSWMLKFDAPYQYCHNITGTFTLIKLGK